MRRVQSQLKGQGQREGRENVFSDLLAMQLHAQPSRTKMIWKKVVSSMAATGSDAGEMVETARE